MSETSGFPGLTVEENVLIGAQFLPANRARGRIDELYAIFPALAERRRLPAGSLSGGQRKMLGIAKALVGNPRLLVMVNRRPACHRSMSRKRSPCWRSSGQRSRRC